MTDYIVRPATPADAEGILNHHKLIADEPNNGVSFNSSDEVIWTIEEEQDVIQRYTEQDDRLFLVAEAQEKIIGVSDCHVVGGRGYAGTFSLGVSVHKAWRGRGVGTAMIVAMIDWCKNLPQSHRLELWVFTNNPRAIALYERLGFQKDGVRRQSYKKGHEYLDLLLMSMLFENKD